MRNGRWRYEQRFDANNPLTLLQIVLALVLRLPDLINLAVHARDLTLLRIQTHGRFDNNVGGLARRDGHFAQAGEHAAFFTGYGIG